jgi:hypothetical protein
MIMSAKATILVIVASIIFSLPFSAESMASELNKANPKKMAPGEAHQYMRKKYPQCERQLMQVCETSSGASLPNFCKSARGLNLSNFNKKNIDEICG